MKKVILDHCVPRDVRKALPHCKVFIAVKLGWHELTNGKLLAIAEEAGFDVLITADKNLRYQQNVSSRKIAIVELPTNSLPKLIPLFTKIAALVNTIENGKYAAI